MKNTVSIFAVAACCMASASALARPGAVLPASLPGASAPAPAQQRPWTIEDIVEVREVTGLARDEGSGGVAFVVKQPSIASGGNAFGLYVLDGKQGAAPRKLLEAAFLGSLSWHPGTRLWTVLADLGKGIQLYEVDAKGAVRTLVNNPATLPVGSHEGYIDGADTEARETGVLSYAWAPDGASLWYSKMRVLSPAQRQAQADGGLNYDDRKLNALALRHPDQALEGLELHSLEARTAADRLLAYAPSSGLDDMMVFQEASMRWAADSRHLRFLLTGTKDNDETEMRLMVADVGSGTVEQAQSGGNDVWNAVAAVPVGVDGDYLMVKQQDAGNHLLRMSLAGQVVKDYGVVPYRGFGWDSQAWVDASGERMIIGTRFRDHEGLAFLPQTPATAAIEQLGDELSHCLPPRGGSGEIVCVRERLDLPQEVVAISTTSGALRVLARPSAERYDAIAPLRSEPQKWSNKYGGISTGYITYPRGFVEGRRYPVIVVTHGGDAQNRFAYYGFQWEHPVQVLAEKGYIVLSVNDPWLTDKTRAASEAFNSGKAGVDVEAEQFEEALNAVASMEAALQSVIDRGIAEPGQAGICGYSRGAEVTEWVMSQSKMFKAASEGDAGGWNSGGYWSFGTRQYVGLYKALYGGSPWDPKAEQWYRRLAPSTRAGEFAGPLLQQFAEASTSVGLELHILLEDAGVPAELDYFPHEAHLFWQPRHRDAAMRRTLAWFDYWLRGIRDPAPEQEAQYRRWDAMAKSWNGGQRHRQESGN